MPVRNGRFGLRRRTLRDFVAAAGLTLQRAGDTLLAIPDEPASRVGERIKLGEFGARCGAHSNGFAPRYFSIVDTAPGSGFTSGASWGSGAGVLLFARAQGGKNAAAGENAIFSTMLFAANADWCSGMSGPLRLWRHAVATGDVSHNLGVLGGGGSGSELLAIGGQFWMKRTRAFKVRLDGVYLLQARNLSHMLTQEFFPFDMSGWGYRTPHARFQTERVQRILSGTHGGCVECRHQNMGSCEFDGMLSFARFRGRYLIYARANLQRSHGGRFVQVATSEGGDPAGPYGPFRLLRIGGVAQPHAANIYFAAVKQNPIDPQTLLGLFPVALSPGAGASLQPRMDDGVVGLSISCDGVSWSPLVVLTNSMAFENRSVDQPADGLLLRGNTVYATVHRNVPHICKGRQHASSYLEPHAIDRTLLQKMVSAAHETLPGCAAASASSAQRSAKTEVTKFT